MPKWEYKIIKAKNHPYLQDEINIHGLEGWELISIKYLKKIGEYQLFFKQPL